MISLFVQTKLDFVHVAVHKNKQGELIYKGEKRSFVDILDLVRNSKGVSKFNPWSNMNWVKKTEMTVQWAEMEDIHLYSTNTSGYSTEEESSSFPSE